MDISRVPLHIKSHSVLYVCVLDILIYACSVFINILILSTLLILGVHARGLQYLSCLCVCLSVCLSVCVFSLFWHLAQSGVQTAVSATSARYVHEI